MYLRAIFLVASFTFLFNNASAESKLSDALKNNTQYNRNNGNRSLIHQNNQNGQNGEETSLKYEVRRYLSECGVDNNDEDNSDFGQHNRWSNNDRRNNNNRNNGDDDESNNDYRGNRNKNRGNRNNSNRYNGNNNRNGYNGFYSNSNRNDDNCDDYNNNNKYHNHNNMMGQQNSNYEIPSYGGVGYNQRNCNYGSDYGYYGSSRGGGYGNRGQQNGFGTNNNNNNNGYRNNGYDRNGYGNNNNNNGYGNQNGYGQSGYNQNGYNQNPSNGFFGSSSYDDNNRNNDRYSFFRTKRSNDDAQCVSQCVFGYLEVLDDNRVPSETLIIKWLQDHMASDIKRIRALREARRCFARLSTSGTDDGCEFSKSLSNCLNLEIE